jgi:hypothetical protein
MLDDDSMEHDSTETEHGARSNSETHDARFRSLERVRRAALALYRTRSPTDELDTMIASLDHAAINAWQHVYRHLCHGASDDIGTRQHALFILMTYIVALALVYAPVLPPIQQEPPRQQVPPIQQAPPTQHPPNRRFVDAGDAASDSDASDAPDSSL